MKNKTQYKASIPFIHSIITSTNTIRTRNKFFLIKNIKNVKYQFLVSFCFSFQLYHLFQLFQLFVQVVSFHEYVFEFLLIFLLRLVLSRNHCILDKDFCHDACASLYQQHLRATQHHLQTVPTAIDHPPSLDISNDIKDTNELFQQCSNVFLLNVQHQLLSYHLAQLLEVSTGIINIIVFSVSVGPNDERRTLV